MRYFVKLALISTFCGSAMAQSTVILVEPLQAAIDDKNQIEKKELPELKTKELELGSIIKGQEEETAKQEAIYKESKKGQDDVVGAWNNNPERQTYESQCATGQVLVGALYQRCRALNEKLVAEKQRLEAQKRRYVDDANAAQQKYNRLVPQLQENRSNLVLNRARQQKLRNWVSQLDLRISAVRRLITDQCTMVPVSASNEEIKHKCGNIQMDGAQFRRAVPACETERCIAFDRRLGN